MQSEWIDVLSQRGDDERHALTYQPGNEADVAAEAVELGDANAWRASTQPQWRITVRLARDEGQSGTLYVTNRGQPFHPNNVDALCEMGLSSKPPGEAVGNKGLGFRSVRHVTNEPRSDAAVRHIDDRIAVVVASLYGMFLLD